ncbi:MAG: acyltransferase domain-containing protein [Clostridiales bacterium]|nr:acyltransferase domain-containing protein [Clostridiales bacterium]
MNLKQLCEMIEMPAEVTKTVLSLSERLPQTGLIRVITQQEKAREAYSELEELCGENRDGYTMLTYMLLAALETQVKYQKKGISDDIFYDTMKCFSRFVREHRASFGRYGFDRGFWTYRQLSMTLFRIGTLEYEYVDEEQVTYIHIPTGANLERPLCAESYAAMFDFTAKYYSDRANYEFILDSWLLSPALDELLDPDSRIIQFKNCFQMDSWNKNAADALQWVFGRRDLSYEQLPEHTSLQRRMKQHFLNGGVIGCARGHLKGF